MLNPDSEAQIGDSPENLITDKTQCESSARQHEKLGADRELPIDHKIRQYYNPGLVHDVNTITAFAQIVGNPVAEIQIFFTKPQ